MELNHIIKFNIVSCNTIPFLKKVPKNRRKRIILMTQFTNTEVEKKFNSQQPPAKPEVYFGLIIFIFDNI